MTDQEPQPLALDEHIDLLRRWRQATKARLGWAKLEEELKEQIDKLLGDTNSGTINGEEAVVRQRINKFAAGKFAEQEPEMARFFEHEVTVREIDVALLKLTRPDLYKKYQVIVMSNKFDG